MKKEITLTQFYKKIESAKKRLLSKPFGENFGQSEVKKLYDLLNSTFDGATARNIAYFKALDNFDNFCQTYTPIK